ncbi:MAG: sugar phosphate isomerase/epimerase [Phycisphaeraceae bacterium]|nr:sugar phosphate isomerase/epimerase [Phycisphaeraceae bacterium]
MIGPPLSIALCGLGPTGPGRGDVREQIAWVRSRGVDAVHLNAAAPGVRARDLDRSGRRDLAAVLRRSGLRLGGVDLWIPPEHFADPAQVDRAMASLMATLELAGEIGALVNGPADGSVVGAVLPESLAADHLAALAGHAERTGARVADHALPPRQATGPIGAGLDPSACLATGVDPVMTASRHARGMFAARLSDVSRMAGGGRVPVGSRDGSLDAPAYAVALSTGGFEGRLAIDLRGLADANSAVASALRALGHSGPA